MLPKIRMGPVSDTLRGCLWEWLPLRQFHGYFKGNEEDIVHSTVFLEVSGPISNAASCYHYVLLFMQSK